MNELYSDLTLVLDDKQRTLSIKTHKIVVYMASPYMRGCLETTTVEDTLTMFVPNVSITYDLIVSLYNINSNVKNYAYWEHLIELIRCKDFLGMNHDKEIDKLSKLQIPPEGINLLIEVMTLIGLPDSGMWIIWNNLPTVFDRQSEYFNMKLYSYLTKISTDQTNY